jgi:tetratricopeptide (TPR) repeat protein
VEASTIYYERAIEAAREADDPRRLGMAHMGLGMARQEARDYDQALSHAAQAMTLFQTAGERRLEAQALTNLALAHAAQEHWAEAVPHLQRALARAREDGDLAHQAHILELLARARAFVGDHAGAAELAGEARVLAEREDDRLEAGAAALTEAAALSALQRREQAEERYRMALEYFRAAGASRRFMSATRAYAATLRDWGRTDEALEILDQAYSTVLNLRQG